MIVVDCKALLFDLDGTLIDSRQSIDIAYKTWCDSHGMNFQEVMQKIHGRRTIDSVRMLLPDKDSDVETQRLEDLECAAIDGLMALSGAKVLIDSLSDRHWAIVTSGSRRLATHRLKHCGIKTPDVFITAGDVINGKPDPEGYKKAADLLGVEYKDCVVFEDAPAGINAARAAGMRSISFPTTHHVAALSGSNYCVADLDGISVEAGESLRVVLRDVLWSASPV